MRTVTRSISVFYLDTSFVALSLLDQEGADQAHRILEEASNRSRVASSVLLRIELVRMARRTRTALSRVYEILDEIHLIGISREVVEGACDLTGELKSLDAIHLATALLLDDPRDPVTVLTHDARLLNAARGRGLTVIDPLEP